MHAIVAKQVFLASAFRPPACFRSSAEE